MEKTLKQALADKAPRIIVGDGRAAVELIRVNPGEFSLGSPPEEAGHDASEGPVRLIKITKPFYLGRGPITQLQYRTISGKNPGRPPGDLFALNQLTYSDALEYCRLLSKRVGAEMTMPTEAQWEYACRAGTTTRFWAGDTEPDLARVGWYRENSDERVHGVGEKPANAWGFVDMHGNVCEFCRDTLLDYEYIPEADPVGKVEARRGIMRGGGRMYPPEYCRSASRVMSNDRFGGAGVRVALNL